MCGALIKNFNPRPRKEGDLVSLSILYQNRVFQSTPSQRGRRTVKSVAFSRDMISIHALAKRATCVFIMYIISIFISIHALAKRATVNNRSFFLFHVISIHALAKRATRNSKLGGMSYDISIHALAKRATFGCFKIDRCAKNFNPRPRKEGD